MTSTGRTIIDRMSSGMDDGLQLSDIMAAFNIPDAEIMPHHGPPVENSVSATSSTSAPSAPALETPVSNLITPIALHQSPTSVQRSNRGRPTTDFKHRLQNAPFEGPSSSMSFGHQPQRPHATDFQRGILLDGPASSPAYGAGMSTEFRHQHEAAMEFDQLEEHSQPMLVYSKEDWPSPDPNVHTSSESDKAITELPDQETPGMTPSSSKGVDHSSTTGISQRVRRTRSGRLVPQKEQRQISVSEGNQKQRSKPRTPYRKKRLEPTLDSDSLKPFRSVMTPEHKSLISKGLSDTEMIELLAELQSLLRLKQRNATRLRRARQTAEQLEEDRRRNRERKRKSRQDPFIEFRHIMTEEQRKLLLQPDLNPATRDTIMTELIAVRKWIDRDKMRKRRAQMTEEQRAVDRRKSREYKRRARSNPLLAFNSVITERHYQLLSQDLDQEQRENLVQELIELKKAKQWDDMRNRRANFSIEHRDQERNDSREYQHVQHQRNGSLNEQNPEGIANVDDNGWIEAIPCSALPAGDCSKINMDDLSRRDQDPGHSAGDSNACMNEPVSPMPKPGSASRSENGSISCESMETLSGDVLKQVNTFTRCEQEKIRNKIRQRRRRAMQTEEEKEEEKRKNRERSRMRRKRLAEIDKVVARERSQRDLLSNQAVKTGHLESMDSNPRKDVRIKTEIDTSFEEDSGNLKISCTSAEQKQLAFSRTLPKEPSDQMVPWFNKQLMEEIRKKNRECTQRARANMTEEQREQERERNRERQRLRRLMQTPEERAAYTERQRNERRRQRQDPVYVERERERQRLRKRALRESPMYRAHETDLYQIRKSRRTRSPGVYMPLIEDINHQRQDEEFIDANQVKEYGSTASEDSIASDEYDELDNELCNDDVEHEEEGSLEESMVDDEGSHDEQEEESSSDFEDMYQRSIKDSKHESTEQLNKDTKEDVGNLNVKISTSIFGLHKILPLNKS